MSETMSVSDMYCFRVGMLEESDFYIQLSDIREIHLGQKPLNSWKLSVRCECRESRQRRNNDKIDK